MNADAVRVVVRLRTLAPTGINPTQSKVIDRLQTLRDTGPVTELDIDTWGASMGISLPNDHDPIGTRKTVTEFEQWAHEHGCTLRPAFERRSTDSNDDNGEGRSKDIRLPLLCLAVYDGETVHAVYPHTDGDTVNTIHDGIEALESMISGDEQPENESSETATVPRP